MGTERRRRGQHGEDADQHSRENQQCLAPQAVGQRAERRSAHGRAQKRRGENRSEIGDLDAERVGDERRRDTDRLGVNAIEQIDQSAANDGTDLKRSQPALVDEARDIYFVGWLVRSES